jgi:hypothetical protein
MTVLPPMSTHEEKKSNSSIRFSSHADIVWLRDDAGVFIFSPKRQKYWLLAGLEAELWDWFVLGYALDLITEHFASMTNATSAAARRGVMRFVGYLVQEGIWVEAS